MNKNELVSFMASNFGESKAYAEKALNLVSDSIVEAIRQGNDISLIGFGSFHIRQREARDGRNPKTGQAMRVAAYKQPVFRAGKKMKDACNGR